MAKVSRQVREIINIVIFLLVVGALLFFYVIYPLNMTAKVFGRSEGKEITLDSLPSNNPESFVQAGFISPDTFRVETDGLTRVAAVYLTPHAQGVADEKPLGLVILLPGIGQTRDSLLPLARMFVDSGYAVATYDERASGLSTGRYHDAGRYEAADLQEVIAYLDLRNRIIHPLSVVGFNLGGDAALLASQGESRIDQIVAISPYLTTDRMLTILDRRNDIMWFPFSKTMLWWWYGIRTDYSTEKRTIQQIQPVNRRTLLLIRDRSVGAEAVEKLETVSSPDLLISTIRPDTTAALYDDIVEFVMKRPGISPPSGN